MGWGFNVSEALDHSYELAVEEADRIAAEYGGRFVAVHIDDVQYGLAGDTWVIRRVCRLQIRIEYHCGFAWDLMQDMEIDY